MFKKYFLFFKQEVGYKLEVLLSSPLKPLKSFVPTSAWDAYQAKVSGCYSYDRSKVGRWQKMGTSYALDTGQIKRGSKMTMWRDDETPSGQPIWSGLLKDQMLGEERPPGEKYSVCISERATECFCKTHEVTHKEKLGFKHLRSPEILRPF